MKIIQIDKESIIPGDIDNHTIYAVHVGKGKMRGESLPKISPEHLMEALDRDDFVFVKVDENDD